MLLVQYGMLHHKVFHIHMYTAVVCFCCPGEVVFVCNSPSHSIPWFTCMFSLLMPIVGDPTSPSPSLLPSGLIPHLPLSCRMASLPISLSPAEWPHSPFTQMMQTKNTTQSLNVALCKREYVLYNPEMYVRSNFTQYVDKVAVVQPYISTFFVCAYIRICSAGRYTEYIVIPRYYLCTVLITAEFFLYRDIVISRYSLRFDRYFK